MNRQLIQLEYIHGIELATSSEYGASEPYTTLIGGVGEMTDDHGA